MLNTQLQRFTFNTLNMPCGLLGKRIVVTGTPDHAHEMSDLLIRNEAIPLVYPTLEIITPDDTSLFDAALKFASKFDWLILTSPEVVLAIAERLRATGTTLHPLPAIAIGERTASTARRLLGIQVKTLSSSLKPRDIVAAMPGIFRRNVLIPQIDTAEVPLARAVEKAGGQVLLVTVCCTVVAQGGVNLPRLLIRGEVDAILFADAASVDSFIARLMVDGSCKCDAQGVTVACMSESAVKAARYHGLSIRAVAQENSPVSLISALEAYYSPRSPL